MSQIAIAAAMAGSSALLTGTTFFGYAGLTAALGHAAVAGGLSFVASALSGTPSTSPGGSTVPPLDHALGFAPFPQYPNSEMPVPTVFGVARLNGAVVHQRVYGGNFEKSHYLAVLSEVGSTLEQLYIDKYRIEDLPNYYTRTSGIHDEFSSWYIVIHGLTNIALNFVSLPDVRLSQEELACRYYAAIEQIARQAVTRVTMHANQVHVMLDKRLLSELLHNAEHAATSLLPDPVPYVKVQDHPQYFEVQIQIAFRRRMGRKMA